MPQARLGYAKRRGPDANQQNKRRTNGEGRKKNEHQQKRPTREGRRGGHVTLFPSQESRPPAAVRRHRASTAAGGFATASSESALPTDGAGALSDRRGQEEADKNEPNKTNQTHDKRHQRIRVGGLISRSRWPGTGTGRPQRLRSR